MPIDQLDQVIIQSYVQNNSKYVIKNNHVLLPYLQYNSCQNICQSADLTGDCAIYILAWVCVFVSVQKHALWPGLRIW